MKKLANKTALITGGSKGIGRAISLAFSREGSEVIFTYAKDKVSAEMLCQDISLQGGRAHAICIDHSNPNSAEEIFQRTVEINPKIDILVNNVGIFHRGSFLEITREQYDEVLYVNFGVPFFLCQHFARYMKSSGSGGSIINISSLSSFLSRSCMAHYQCSKAALTMLSRSLALELGEYGIRVNTVSPGLTATEANRDQWQHKDIVWKERSACIPLRRAGIPEDHAGAVVFLASDDAKWITGADVIIDGGMSIY